MEAATLPRRTQAERRAGTRRRLLDATIESLGEVGYTGTTVRGVAERAGVSQGATTHHFPHRVTLMTAAVEELSERRIADIRAAVAEMPADPAERLRAALEWFRSAFSGPLFAAWVRLWIAAADDRELHARMIAVDRRLWEAIGKLAREMLPEAAADPTFDARLAIIASTLRGLGFQEEFEPRDRKRSVDPWPIHRAGLELLATAPAAELGLRGR
jgi:AcrR family transcriptional regulator